MFPFTPHTTLRLGLRSGGFLMSGFELELITVMLAEAHAPKQFCISPNWVRLQLGAESKNIFYVVKVNADDISKHALSPVIRLNSSQTQDKH
jgi:hypothetical protein